MKSTRKTTILLAAVSAFLYTSCVTSKGLSGEAQGLDFEIYNEHSNGVRYEMYNGPESIDEERLNAVCDALSSHEYLHVGDAIKVVLAESRSHKWTSGQPTYISVRSRDLLVGIEYYKGPVRLVFYQNQIMAAFWDPLIDAPVEIYIYIDKESLEITAEVSFYHDPLYADLFGN